MNHEKASFWRASHVGIFLGVGLWISLCCSSVWAWHSLTSGGRCKQTNNACRTTIGNAGGANACCDPRSSGLATCASQNSCDGGNPYRWPTMPVTWSLNLNNMPGNSGFQGKTAASIEAAMKSAWDAWTQPNCTSFAHQYQGRTSTRYTTSDRKLVCYLASSSDWASLRLPSGVLAFARPTAGSNGILVDADIVFNPTPAGRRWGITPNVQAQEMDFADVAAHEIGHAIGFGHTAPRSSLMYFSVRGVGPLFNGITSDEEAGVCTIYPVQSCSSNTQCGTCRSCNNGKCGPKQFSSPPELCKPCKSNADCNGNSCVEVDGRFRCIRPCDAQGCCPSGTACKSQGGQSLCIPDSQTCPPATCSGSADCGTGESCQAGTCKKSCQQDTDCAAGFVCQSQACVEAQPAKLGEPCSSNIPCVAGTDCANTPQGQICAVSCGSGTGGFKSGDPGTSCGSCASGLRCVRINNIAVCLRLCSGSSQCQGAEGGLCVRFGNSSTALCMCRNDADCGGNSCNKDVIGQIGLGACAQRSGGTCPTGYQCNGQYCLSETGGSTCGNGVCEASENCTGCAQDCACPAGQACQSGSCVTPSTCGNGTCDNGENCESCSNDCACGASEVCRAGTCEQDTPQCGNGICDNNETCDGCQEDCRCPEGLGCNQGLCQPLISCGDGTCGSDEACDSCPQDCGCSASQVCLGGQCQAAMSEVPLEGIAITETPTTPDGGRPEQGSPDVVTINPDKAVGTFGGPCRSDGSCSGDNLCVQQPGGSSICLKPTGRPQGCGCQSQTGPWSLSWLLMLCLLLPFWRRKRSSGV